MIILYMVISLYARNMLALGLTLLHNYISPIFRKFAQIYNKQQQNDYSGTIKTDL